jgi:hypothetical protein
MVAISTISLAHSFYPGVILTGFLISFFWTLNVSRIAVSTMKERIIYSTGAMTGSILGLLTTKLFI